MADDDAGEYVADRFADLVARLDTAMVVVTTAVDGERSGCLVGFHSQCSIDPPGYAVWISKANHTCGLVERATHFAVHALDDDQRPIAGLFGGTTGDQIDKFGRCPWSDGPGGVPLLDDCPTRFVGRKIATSDVGGDHVGVILEPIDVTIGPAAGRLVRLSDLNDLTPGHEA